MNPPNIFTTQLLAQSQKNHARSLKVTTPHGEFITPTFMPVGTRAFVNCMLPDHLQAAGSQIILGGNTYHMLCSPGLEMIEKAGGMHTFMGWNGPMLTDSGGYQVFSLSENKKICVIEEDGAHFKHPVSGSILHLTPRTSIEAQKVIGADIIMAFDQCTPENKTETEVAHIMDRTYRWLLESKAAHDAHPHSQYGKKQAFFGIIQGGYIRALREKCAEQVLSIDPDGIALGGEVVGANMEKTLEILDWLHPILPQDKVRYTMGVGLNPQNLLDVVAHGADIFDCVAPTRNARHGALYCGKFVIENNWPKFIPTADEGRLLIKKVMFAEQHIPVEESCDCYTCKNFTRAYLHYLFRDDASAYYPLACIHNVRMMQRACEGMRGCLRQ